MSEGGYEPGWYRTPQRPHQERYYDGERWTDAFRDPPEDEPPSASPSRERGGFRIWKVVVAIIVAIAIINGIRAASGQSTTSTPAPSYQVVPCATHPEAIGCSQP